MSRPSLARIKEFSEGLPSFGKVLWAKRQVKKISVLGAGEASGMGSDEWSHLEHGRLWPREKYYEYIATFLDTTPALLKQDIKRIQHEQDEWCKKYQDVTDWLKKMGENNASVRTLVLR